MNSMGRIFGLVALLVLGVFIYAILNMLISSA